VPQEESIPSLVAEGKTNREIWRRAEPGEKTVMNYVSGIPSELEIARRA
jgi:DNA-binding NarL/FixJ family response regulator